MSRDLNPRRCSLDDCARSHFGRGYCQLHYDRWRAKGDPNALRNGSISDRLASMSTPEGECIVWTRSTNRYGYGRITIRPRGVLGAHRVTWEVANGPIPDGLVVRHKCDNPPCINPDHLELGTIADNQRDMKERGRSAPAKGSQNNLAKLSEADIPAIREAVRSGSTQRAVADRHGVTPGAISQILRGVTWTHVA